MASTTIQMQRKGHGLEINSPVWINIIEQYPENVNLNVKITRARSVRQNGTYWGLLKFVVDHGPEYISARWPTDDELSDALQLEVGFVKQIKLANGMNYAIPASKSFNECRQDRFNEYFNKAQAKLIEWCNYDPLPLYMRWLEERHTRPVAEQRGAA